jgi:hypothetical protein
VRFLEVQFIAMRTVGLGERVAVVLAAAEQNHAHEWLRRKRAGAANGLIAWQAGRTVYRPYSVMDAACMRSPQYISNLLKIIFCEAKAVAIENHIDSDAELQYLLKKQSQKSMRISC